jgi:FAD-dependent oxidoreductase domain-containing protein 1
MLSAGGIRHQFSERANVLLSQYGTEFLRSIPSRLRVDESQDAPDIQFVEGGYLFLASENGRAVLEANHKVQRYVVSASSSLSVGGSSTNKCRSP